jgi:hypothetical protein
MGWIEELRGKIVGMDTAPDAIQMATAINANASFFLTNDMSLPSLSNLKMLQLDELKTRQ